MAIGCTSYPCSPKADFSEGEAILARYRAANGDTSQALGSDLSLENALGAAIEVQAHVRAGKGRRSDAVYFLQRELETYANTPRLAARGTN